MNHPLIDPLPARAVVAAEAAAAKRYVDGTHRTCSPAETLARVRPWLGRMGITRIANVTGLDRTGVHVVAVSRPNARSISVAQGKGLTLDAAKASGVMEAIEVWHAERILKPLKLGSANELSREHRVAAIDELPRARAVPIDADAPTLWIEGTDLFTGEAVWVPYEIVSTNYTVPALPGGGWFQTNTKGLASGNHRLEAICHAVCELVEMDARTLWRLAGPKRRRLLDLDSVDDEACRSVIAKLESAGLRVRVWDITTDVGIAAFLCAVLGEEDDADPEFGAGCHPARNVALLRAITEAGQARNTYISAARDDYFPDLYAADRRAARKATFRCWLAVDDVRRGFADVPTRAANTLAEDLAWILARLRACGIEEAIVVDLAQPEIGIPVVRAVVPGLEGVMEHADCGYVGGERARREAALG